jgi:hypothetical protein
MAAQVPAHGPDIDSGVAEAAQHSSSGFCALTIGSVGVSKPSL